jgi:hypothetical protein
MQNAGVGVQDKSLENNELCYNPNSGQNVCIEQRIVLNR